ncbi:VOC family protein [Litoreibacter sp.]|nr:VOC family protein [Litoreibacter sp.]
MIPKLDGLDHLVLTVTDLKATLAFYQDVLGMQVEEFRPSDGSHRVALMFGAQKINLQVAGAEFEPKAIHATPGSADLCFISATDLGVWQAHFKDKDVEILQGPVARTGATSPLMSLYIRDPDGNLIEISNRT